MKNVVLVMHSSGLLVPPPAEGSDKRSSEQKELWLHSAGRIERILPGFLEEAIPPTRGEEEVVAQTSQPSPAPGQEAAAGPEEVAA